MDTFSNISGGSKGIRTPGSVGRTHDVFIFIATVAILFLATQKPDFRLFWPYILHKKSKLKSAVFTADTY